MMVGIGCPLMTNHQMGKQIQHLLSCSTQAVPTMALMYFIKRNM
jgi:hypothetical protein